MIFNQPPKRIRPIEPLVVFDWGVLQGWPRGESLPADLSILIPETPLLEIVGRIQDNPSQPASQQKTDQQLDGYARKLARHIRDCKERFWIGRYWDEISKGEFSPHVVVRTEHLVHAELSPALMGEDFIEPDEWASAARKILHDGAHQEHEARKTTFLRFVDDWARFLRERDADDFDALRASSELQRDWIRSPGLVKVWLAKENPAKFSTSPWQAALDRWPDHVASARWARLLAWYALQRSLEPDRAVKDVGNWFDDAHYAFLSSYTKCVATEDDDLIKAVETVYSGVRVWKPRRDGSQHPFRA